MARNAILRLTEESIIGALQGSYELVGLPSDAKPVRAAYDWPSGMFLILLQSSQFDEVADGETPPFLHSTFGSEIRRRPDGSGKIVFREFL
jgi:hypothetical protein